MTTTSPPDRGFLTDLFDVRFRRFITTRVVSVLYVLAILFLAFAVIGQIVTAFNVGSGFGVFMLLIGGPLIFFGGLLYFRVVLEVLVVLFRIGDDTGRVRTLLEEQAQASD